MSLDKIVLKGTTHVIKMRRFARGRSVIGNATLYGYELSCSCGWARRWNGTKREARSYGMDHLREQKGS